MRKPKVSANPEHVRLAAAIAALHDLGAGPLLEELRNAQVETLLDDFGSRAAVNGGLMCVDGFCVEPFLDAATALEIPDYDVTELVEICLRSGPWAKIDVSERWSAGRVSGAFGRLRLGR